MQAKFVASREKLFSLNISLAIFCYKYQLKREIEFEILFSMIRLPPLDHLVVPLIMEVKPQGPLPPHLPPELATQVTPEPEDIRLKVAPPGGRIRNQLGK